MKKILAVLLILSVASVCGCGKAQVVSVVGEGEISDVDMMSESEAISVFSYKPDTFCPILSTNKANVRMLGIIYESLISLSDELVPIPNLAEKWSVSENGLEWTVKLRDGVLWHDGTSFGTADVVYTVNKIKENRESAYAYNVSMVSDVRGAGENTVIFKLYEPSPTFVSLLYFPIIKNNSVTEDGSDFKPIGTGAFSFEDRNEGNIYYLVRNENWWGGNAKSEYIKVKMLPDKNTALYAFNSGIIDLTGAEGLDWGKFVDSNVASYVRVNTPIYNFIGLNHENELLKMEEVRRAISFAVDREKILNEAVMGYGEAVNVPLRSGWFLCENKNERYVRNTKMAQEVLLKNGWEIANGAYQKREEGKTHRLRLRLLINEENVVRENVAQMIKKNLEDFGISITIAKVPFAEYEERIASGKYDMFVGGYSLSPDLNMKALLGGGNLFRFNDDEINMVLEELKTKKSSEEIKTSYTEVMNLFEQTCPIVGLYFEDNVMIYANKIKGNVTPSYFEWYDGIEKLQKGASKK